MTTTGRASSSGKASAFLEGPVTLARLEQPLFSIGLEKVAVSGSSVPV